MSLVSKLPKPDPPRRPSLVARVGDLVADPSFAPREWQSPAPGDMWARQPPVANSPDLERILALPRRPPVDLHSARAEALVEVVTERYALPPGPCICASLGRECITRLRPVQAWALHEIALRGGLLGAVGVGFGKTFLNILAPLAMPDCRLALLLVPPSLVSQLVAEYRLVGQHFRVPSLVVHGNAFRAVVADAPVLHVLPYSRLRMGESTVFLDRLKPDTVISDECQFLRNAGTATTSRVLRYFHAFGATRFCGWSGSITDKSIRDYAHLAALSLRAASPLPLDPDVVDDWARALDPGDWPAPAGALLRFCEPGEHVRSGFHRRLVQTAGVVATSEPAIDAELWITEREAPPIPSQLKATINAVRQTMVRPDGEELVDALTLDACLRQLACGFFYRWRFPRGEPRDVIDAWFEARKLWRRELRVKLKARLEHLDSPMLCARAAARAWGDVESTPGLPIWEAEHWPLWRDLRSTVQPEPEAVRIDDYLARDAAAWALEHRGVVWYEHRTFGEWVAQIAGLPLHGGGPQAGELIARERGDRSIVASLKAHGTGRDGLQRLYYEQLVANPPSSSTQWEQVLGRLLRIGQEAPRVMAEFYRHTPELARHVDQALSRALYVEQTLGAAQKLRTGWRVPKVDPSTRNSDLQESTDGGIE